MFFGWEGAAFLYDLLKWGKSIVSRTCLFLVANTLYKYVLQMVVILALRGHNWVHFVHRL